MTQRPILNLRDHLLAGQVIPAHPLALTPERRLDVRCQRALTRYYLAAGAGGIAVGVHTTQFAIREPKHDLLRPVLELAMETADAALTQSPRPFARIAGICGQTAQAVAEAEFARSLGYDAGLLSLGALSNADEIALIAHCAAVAEVIPLFGFYLQSAVGGRVLRREFWRRFVEIENVVAIKIAPFNRYQTLDVVRAVAESGRTDVALYTGNDDAIFSDLLTPFEVPVEEKRIQLHFAGGLLGHWAVGTRFAVETLQAAQAARASGTVSASLLTLAAQITDANAALFDAANGFRGCIAGIHAVLHHAGLMTGIACLDPAETLSLGQDAEIERVLAQYPDHFDLEFIAQNRDRWLC
jgi:dihydrodipicolinate synthase/N-acetylneuraminate lyase